MTEGLAEHVAQVGHGPRREATGGLGIQERLDVRGSELDERLRSKAWDEVEPDDAAIADVRLEPNRAAHDLAQSVLEVHPEEEYGRWVGWSRWAGLERQGGPGWSRPPVVELGRSDDRRHRLMEPAGHGPPYSCWDGPIHPSRSVTSQGRGGSLGSDVMAYAAVTGRFQLE